MRPTLPQVVAGGSPPPSSSLLPPPTHPAEAAGYSSYSGRGSNTYRHIVHHAYLASTVELQILKNERMKESVLLIWQRFCSGLLSQPRFKVLLGKGFPRDLIKRSPFGIKPFKRVLDAS